MPELWDCNSLYLGSPHRPPQFAVQSRYTMTPEEMRAYRDDPARQEERARRSEELRALRAERKALVAAAETRLAARRREQAEEHARFEQEFAAAQEKRKAEQEQRDREWARVEVETQQYLAERTWILAGSWECASCLRPSQINVEPNGRYALSCRACGRRAVGDHATLAAIVARKHQPEPEIVGFRR